VAGRRGAVVEDDLYNKLEKLNVQAGKRDKILLAHVQRICEAHDTVRFAYAKRMIRLTWTVYATPLMTLTTDLGLSIRVYMFEHVDW